VIINRGALLRAAPIKNMLTTKERAHGVSHGLAEVGYDIRIKQDIIFYPPSASHRHGHIGIFQDPDLETHIEGSFTLASAIEEFDMPTHLTATVRDKSTWARRGLSVFNTVIEPGWKGFLTLELVFHSQDMVVIPAGAGIAQVIFEEIAEPAQYEGKYQNQPDRPVEPKAS
jgi:dCTP deaminase